MARIVAAYYYDRRWLEKRRLEKGFTQAHMAEVAGVSLATYNRIEAGFQTPSIHRGMRICKELDLDPQVFLSEKKIVIRPES